jgi:hypothetical protein
LPESCSMGDDFVEDWIGINAPSGVGLTRTRHAGPVK